MLAPQEALQRAQSPSHLPRPVGAAGDLFEAARIGEDAAKLLASMGYRDAEHEFAALLCASANLSDVARVCNFQLGPHPNGPPGRGILGPLRSTDPAGALAVS